ncbi:MAG: CPBP family intramembrane metalloprotease [Nocardioides sp.]|nr:CPBP family intramembrane metalloprotease [Nocardioides sp.]
MTSLRWVRQTLWEVSPRDHRQAPGAFRRRQVVSAAFIALGGVVLAFSLRIEPGSAWFYPATLALALVWTIGAFASGPIHLGRLGHPMTADRPAARPVLPPVVLGALLAGIFIIGALLVRLFPSLAELVRLVLAHANEGSAVILLGVTILNGIAEELFFRGALYSAVPVRPVLVTTVAYALTTAATGNVMLAFAALVLGFVVGLERRATGGILAPILTHLVWSVTMLYALPALL